MRPMMAKRSRNERSETTKTRPRRRNPNQPFSSRKGRFIYQKEKALKKKSLEEEEEAYHGRDEMTLVLAYYVTMHFKVRE